MGKLIAYLFAIGNPATYQLLSYKHWFRPEALRPTFSDGLPCAWHYYQKW